MGESGGEPERFLVISLQTGFDYLTRQAGALAALGHDAQLVTDFTDRGPIFRRGAYLTVGNAFAETYVHTVETQINAMCKRKLVQMIMVVN